MKTIAWIGGAVYALIMIGLFDVVGAIIVILSYFLFLFVFER